MKIVAVILSLFGFTDDCDQRTLTHNNDFRVEYKLCDNALTDTVYYYFKNTVLLKEYWQEGRSSFASYGLTASRMDSELRQLRAVFFGKVRLVSYDKFRSKKETEVIIKNADLNMNAYSTSDAMITKTEKGITINPQVPKGDSIKIYVRYGTSQSFLLIKEKVQ
jgi:hypothetical protein